MMTVIYPGVDPRFKPLTTALREEARLALGFSVGTPVIMIVATSAYTNNANAIKAVALLEKARGSPVQLAWLAADQSAAERYSEARDLQNPIVSLDRWRWHEGELGDALQHALCAVSLNTAAVTDSVIAGCVPCTLTAAQDVEWNYFGSLEDRFSVARAVPDESIEARLEKIFISRREELQLETLELREHLVRAFNLTTEATMAAFL